jgi:signal transduction histidine kinase
MKKERTIAETYSALVAEHVASPSEVTLAAASDLGKEMVRADVPIEVVVEMHEEALQELAAARPALALKDAAILATQPLMETFMAYGLAFRRQIDDAVRANESMQLEIARRRRVEAALEARTQELLRSNVELEQFASVVSHDLRAPLQSVGGFAEILLESYGPRMEPKARDMVRAVLDGTQRMGDLITDLLRLARVGHGDLDIQAVDLGQVMERVRTDFAAEIVRRDAKVSWEALPVVHADPGQMLQLLANLVGNALKFGGDRSPVVHVAAAPRDGDWIVSVRDEGIGIDPKHAGEIFGMFRRLGTHPDVPGTGIGLAICRKIVERHRGRIWVDSEPGKGSTFRFTIPIPEPASGTGA